MSCPRVAFSGTIEAAPVSRRRRPLESMVKRKTKKKKPRRRLPTLVLEKVVPRLVAELNESSSCPGLAQALAAADIICKTLYRGEPKRSGVPGRRLGPIFNRLTRADGVPYSQATLRRFLGVHELYRRIDGARLRHIGLSHYILVLPFTRDVQRKALEIASEKRVPATKLEAMVRGWRREKPKCS